MTRSGDARGRDPGRERLLRLEQQARARAEAQAVADGVAETVALSRARGAAIAAPARAQRRVRAQPYRRQSGLAWLAGKGRLTAAEAAAGERYGRAYRRAKMEPGIPSTLGDGVRGADPSGPSLAELMTHADGTAMAHAALAGMRTRLMRQPDLVAACDLVCGEEKTPREAAGGDREAARLEAVLKVALDLLAN